MMIFHKGKKYFREICENIEVFFTLRLTFFQVSQKIKTDCKSLFLFEVPDGIEPSYEVLQTSA